MLIENERERQIFLAGVVAAIGCVLNHSKADEDAQIHFTNRVFLEVRGNLHDRENDITALSEVVADAEQMADEALVKILEEAH